MMRTHNLGKNEWKFTIFRIETVKLTSEIKKLQQAALI